MCDLCAVGNDPNRIQQQVEQYWAGVRRAIRARGWFVQWVAGGLISPPFAYTIGLTSLRHPELVVFGLCAESSAGLLNGLGEQVRGGRSLHDGDIVVAVSEHTSEATLFSLPNPGRVLLRAKEFYRHPSRISVRALQVVYPDSSGAYPWEPDCQLRPSSQPLPGQFAA
jgi:hypothetical protein